MHTIIALFITLMFVSCGSKDINVLDYNKKITTKSFVPLACQKEFVNKLPKVAVVGFTNNSSFGKQKSSSSLSKKRFNAMAGLGYGSGGVVAGAKSSSDGESTTLTGDIDPKLSGYIVPLVESYILGIGGVELFARADFEKVNSELKLQDSGLLDQKSVVEVGRTSGVEYIITGSVNSLSYKESTLTDATKSIERATRRADDDSVKIAGALLDMAANLTSGVELKTSMTLKMIDVRTGKVVLSKNSIEDKTIRGIKMPTYQQQIEFLKEVLASSLDSLTEQIKPYFGLKGYITQVRFNDDGVIAQVNLGSKEGIKRGDILDIYSFEESMDPLSNESFCDKNKLPFSLRVSGQISKERSWTTLDSEYKDRVKTLQFVKRR
jgi:hypothetical protein